ncbi:unnamed protein product [Toxocara canis]|uniref:F-box domain-containing protein n=1 Tax=Toxocara canis TaxID=6265 RepID=A0A183UI62_TOXCA|nr:unnamed protein product [Toxocara canis]
MKLPIFMRIRCLIRSPRKKQYEKDIEDDINGSVPAALLPVDLLERIFRELPPEAMPTVWDVCRPWRNAVYLRRSRLPRIHRKQIIVRYGVANERLQSELRRRSPLKEMILNNVDLIVEIGPLSFVVSERTESTPRKGNNKKCISYARYRLHYFFDVSFLNASFISFKQSGRLVLNLSHGGLDARSLAMQLPLICEDIVCNTAIRSVDLLFKRNDGVDMAWIGPLLQSKKRVVVYVLDT